jgi:hypothetical protein
MKKLDICKTNEASTIKSVGTKRKTRLTLLEHIEKIVELSDNSMLNGDFFEKAKKHIACVKRLLHLNDIQAVFLSHFIDRSSNGQILISDIAKVIGCRNIKLLQYMDDIDVLEKRRLVRCCRCKLSISYRVPREVVNALRQNKEYCPADRKNISIHAFFNELDQLFAELNEKELTYPLFAEEVESLFEDNPQLQFIQIFGKYGLDSYNRILLLRFCNLFVENADDNIRFSDFEDDFPRHNFRILKNSLQSKSNILFEKELIECNYDDGFEDRASFCLTDKAKNELLGELDLQIRKVNRGKDILVHESLVVKQMYYNEKEQKQVAQLIDLLREENFINVQKRLKEKGMRTGFACLFHGAPGTGKTETVYQIARQTQRNIFMVDISETKSMWFGESEKRIKGLFEKYKALVKSEKSMTVLLFNEADAVIGKRKDTASGNCAQTENAIQNIILQEMENLDGIMIATTNLTQNLDKAFERRFLYKIEFEKPCNEAKRHIWQSIIPTLQDYDAAKLARCFDFSGGQIENIARKCAVDSIILGEEPTLNTLMFHCKHELLTNSRKPIGFNVN